MPKVPIKAIKESYFLKSTFFYNRLKSGGYFTLFVKVRKLAKLEGAKLNWDDRNSFDISEAAWDLLKKNKIEPIEVFIHPKILLLYPSLLKYYRSVAMLSQKGLKSLSGVSMIERIESDKIPSGKLKQDTILKIAKVINEILSLVLSLAPEITHENLKGMMYATAGTNIDGSWRNAIGTEGERVIRSIILREILIQNEVSSIEDKKGNTIGIDELKADQILDDIEAIKLVNLVNGYSILFSSEPDVCMYDDKGAIVGVIEIKAGLDPAGALERLGAMLKSFENTLEEYPSAITILVASCITSEVEARLSASMTVRLKYATTDITDSDSSQRKFANRIRKVLKLTK